MSLFAITDTLQSLEGDIIFTLGITGLDDVVGVVVAADGDSVATPDAASDFVDRGLVT
jgi:hypothetical protein